MNVPAEDLVVIARVLDHDAPQMLLQKSEWPDEPCGDWRDFIPDPLRRIWGRIGLEGRLTAYVVAETTLRARESDG